jgi:site-specific DNA recombinase
MLGRILRKTSPTAQVGDTHRMRSAIYARFSTDLQNERSIDDQIALCQEYAKREKLEVVTVYEDRARSGGSILGRDGLIQLIDDAKAGKFEVVIVEALDRLSRDMEDLAGLHKRLTFLGVQIRAIFEGQVNTVLVGLRGLVGQLYREDNAHKVRRGLAGRVREGRSAGGLPYGYATVPGEPGRRVIVESEAAVVRRIFEEYASGRSPRDICYGLNRDAIPAPAGRSWVASTLNGNAKRSSGILTNEAYIGRLVWNRCRKIKDPDTGKRIQRANDSSIWHRTEVPDLAIVPIGLFEAVKGRKAANATVHPSHQRRPRHLLSGLLRCGACGGGMSTNGKDKSSRIRIRCSRYKESGDCPDPATFYLPTIEGAVVVGLKQEMRKPAVIAEYVRTYHAERARLATEINSHRERLERRLLEVDQESERIVDYLVRGLGNENRLDVRAKELAAEEKRLRSELAAALPKMDVIALHPTILARYEAGLGELERGLTKGLNSGDQEGIRAVHDLIDAVTVFRGESGPGSVRIEISGRLNALLGEEAFPNRVWGVMVPQEGIEPPTYALRMRRSTD